MVLRVSVLHDRVNCTFACDPEGITTAPSGSNSGRCSAVTSLEWHTRGLFPPLTRLENPRISAAGVISLPQHLFEHFLARVKTCCTGAFAIKALSQPNDCVSMLKGIARSFVHIEEGSPTPSWYQTKVPLHVIHKRVRPCYW